MIRKVDILEEVPQFFLERKREKLKEAGSDKA